MAKYDGLIIPRSYSEYINKTDAATHQQAHQVNGVLDDTPTEDSPKAVKSGGVYDALAGKQPTLTFDNVPTENSSNPVTSDGIYDALGGRSGITWDNVPTEDSDNPVMSGGIYDALAAMEIPVGTIIAQYKKAAPAGYLYLDGSTFNAAEYPSLYAYLGNSNTLPDYREFALVGAEQNSTDTIATHDVYTEGEGKDDQLQFHKHNIGANGDPNYPLGYGAEWSTTYNNAISKTATTKGIAVRTSNIYQGRNNDVTRGKRKAVFFYIKAVSIADIL